MMFRVVDAVIVFRIVFVLERGVWQTLQGEMRQGEGANLRARIAWYLHTARNKRKDRVGRNCDWIKCTMGSCRAWLLL